MVQRIARVIVRGYDYVNDIDEARQALVDVFGDDRDVQQVGPVDFAIYLDQTETVDLLRDGIIKRGIDPQVEVRLRWRALSSGGAR